MKIMSIANCERFFRTAAGIDIDKEDVRRYTLTPERDRAQRAFGCVVVDQLR